ncbi:hypothetical protein [Pandoraea eparura]|uniref:hypothetical protein n=1 Tax=Pandoraea eparura TaxID=2508291 RepID=UPI00123F9C1D|nr:hypothetical protein [Pandoraea eparura]
MKKSNASQITIFIAGSCSILAAMVLAIRFIISIYVFIKNGEFTFGIEDFTYSAKAGLAAGIPLGIGSWILTKIEEHSRNK